MINLLLVEDDKSLAFIEKTGLEEIIGGYEVTVAENGAEGYELWQKKSPDVIIADIDMPVMNGFEMVEKIRKSDNEVIIIFTSALTSPDDVKAGYRLGINNYVKKPFDPSELDAHIRALVKMKNGEKIRNTASIFEIGLFKFDAEQSTLHDSKKDKTMTLTAMETGILQLLAENKNEVVRREAILNRFWNTEDDYFASRSLDVFVTKLRKKLSTDPSIEIKTVRGVGLALIEK